MSLTVQFNQDLGAGDLHLLYPVFEMVLESTAQGEASEAS
jgi:hypothetical protein